MSVASPCISVCRLDAASGLCAGCFRTLDEITSWRRLSEAQQRAVWEKLAERKARLGAQPLPPVTGKG